MIESRRLRAFALDVLPRRLALVLCASLFGLASSALAQSGGGADEPESRGAQAREPTVTRAPELLRFVVADLPEVERTRTGSVTSVLRLLIDVDGRVAEAALEETSGSARLDEAALAAARAFEFRPAEVDGRPSPIQIIFRYVFTFEPPPSSNGSLEGRVVERGPKRAVAGVRVTLSGGQLEAPRSDITDAEGHFSFPDVPPGEITVDLEAARLTPISTRETLGAREHLEVVYEVGPRAPPDEPAEGDDLEIVVSAPPMRRELVATSVSSDEARGVPGTSGDVLRVVESLPGVARASVGSGALVIWGAAPEETRVYVDGVPVPRLYHEGGLRSIVHSDFVEEIELIPGGQGPSYGRNLGGLLAVDTRMPDEAGLHGRVAADVLDASVMLAGPLGEDVRLGGAARWSLLDLWTQLGRGEEIAEYIPIPRYRDGQLRLLAHPSAHDRLELVVLGSSDRFARGVPNADPSLSTREVRALDFGRVFLRWSRETKDGGAVSVTPWIGLDRSARESTYGDILTRIGANTLWGGLRLSHRRKWGERVVVEAGLDAELSRSALERQGSIGLPPREGDVRVFGQPPPDRIAADDWRVTTVGIAPYAALDLKLLESLSVSPGLRIDPYVRTVSRRVPREGDLPEVGLLKQSFAAEPRLSVHHRALEWIALRGAFSLTHQPPAPEDLSAAFGTPDLTPARALHAVAGIDLRFEERLTLEVTGFWVRSSGLAMRDASDAPYRARALVPTGSGRNFGAQALLRRSFGDGLSGWLAYTWMRSDRRDREGAGWRASDYEQTHVLAAVLSHRLPFGIEMGLRFRLATGFPRTGVLGAFYDASRDRYQPVFGLQNRERIPLFLQLDARASKMFLLGGTQLEVSLEVLNVANRANAEELVYAPDYSRRDVVRGLPILPVLGVGWRF